MMLSMNELPSLTYTAVLTYAAVTILLVGLIVAVKRVYFHPLSKFPGPRIGTLTNWYNLYFNIIKKGIAIKQWPELHKKYGASKSTQGEPYCR